jgi:hypothetical protein
MVVYGNEHIYSERTYGYRLGTTPYFVLAHFQELNNPTQLICAFNDPIIDYEGITIRYCPMCGREL